MPKYANCVIEPDRHPLWQAPDGSREVTPLITGEICGAESCSAGLWWLHPGQECTPDIHPDADELYYVVSGEGKLLLGDEEYAVRKGMTVFIPRNVRHQSFNTGDEDLCYYWVFAPQPSEVAKQDAQGWNQLR